MQADKKKVAIIGACVGGITTAILLAQEGYKVDVYEKNPFAGGRCGQMTKDGHRFDIGATILLMPSIYRKVFSQMGLDLDMLTECEPLNPIYRLYFSDGSQFQFSQNQEEMISQIETFEKGATQKYKSYIDEGYRFFQLGMGKLLGRNFYHLFQFINLRSLIAIIKLKAWVKHTDYISNFFSDHRLQKAFTFQNIYVGQNPYQQPAFFSMLPGAEINEGALFPKGGMHRIVTELHKHALNIGVNFHFNQEVTKLSTENGKISSMTANGKSIQADIFVANADLPYVYNQLLPFENATHRINKMKYSCSAMVFHWGVRKKYSQLAHHSVFLCDPYKEGMDKIFNEKSLSSSPSFYIHAPATTDKDAAPGGEESLSVIIPMGHIDTKKYQNWEELKSTTRKAVIKRLKETGMTDIEENIKFEICFTPKTFESYCHVARGAVFGSISHTLLQMGYFRPHNQHRKFKNLYFTGGSTHPGNGVPLVLLTALFTSQRILKNNPS
jgi:phytoene desaturase